MATVQDGKCVDCISLLKYIKKLEEYKSLFSDKKDIEKFNCYIADTIKRNDKRNWSVVRYIGNSIFPMTAFTTGRACTGI